MLSSLAFVSFVLCYALVVGFSVCQGLRFGTLAVALAVAVSASCAAEPACGRPQPVSKTKRPFPPARRHGPPRQRKSTSLTRTEYARMQDTWAPAREQLVKHELLGAGIKHLRVLDAIRVTPRHEFIPIKLRRYAYFDMNLPIGKSQTITSPYTVAYMTEQLDLQPTDKVLEIGTGSGYQAAVLNRFVANVYSVEIVEELGKLRSGDALAIGL